MNDRQTVGIEPGSEDCRTNPELARDAAAAIPTAKGSATAAQADRRPNWDRWADVPEATIGEAVALSEDIGPEKVDWGKGAEFGTAPAESQSFNNRLFVAVRHAGIGKPLTIVSGSSENPTIDSMIRLEDFVALARKKRWRLPAELEEFYGGYDPPYDSYWDTVCGTGARPEASLQHFGNHSTKRLRLLAAAAQRFWGELYDASEPTTAPTNEMVTKWLTAQGESDRMAEAMASILRADDLPAGRRKK
ncbi:hypothetical protein QF000_005731 [Paraburkholderia atlantica]|uniref:hypothetical protein n=1 Tax=Paraburkholderia atlantica TaxID=2654982 RepID=UPI003D24DAA3